LLRYETSAGQFILLSRSSSFSLPSVLPLRSPSYLPKADTHLRVHAHAAAALINFCEGVEREILLPYLDPIVERLLKLLNPGGDQAAVKRYVQEQAVTTLAMVADASEGGFAKVCRQTPVLTAVRV
jgi:hypothetical protein